MKREGRGLLKSAVSPGDETAPCILIDASFRDYGGLPWASGKFVHEIDFTNKRMDKKTKAERREGRKKNRKYVLHNKNASQIYSNVVKKRGNKRAV